ncbi:MAG: alpha/beta hydrolase [Pirellulaceae bacterium]
MKLPPTTFFRSVSIAWGWVILTAIVVGSSCSNSSSTPRSLELQANASIPEWGGLNVITRGAELDDAEWVVVMLHGFGAPAEDLVPMSRFISPSPETCFAFPAAPIALGNGGRAWWNRGGPDMESALEKIVALLDFVHTRNSNARIVLGGFSQGAILTSNLLGEHPQRLAAAVLLAPSGRVQRERDASVPKPHIFLAHGRSDDRLPFDGSLQLREQLLGEGFSIEWVPFDGGHTIPPMVVEELAAFLKQLCDATADPNGSGN